MVAGYLNCSGSDQMMVIAKVHSSKKFCNDDSAAEKEPRWLASVEFWTNNCAVRSNDQSPMRERMTQAMKRYVVKTGERGGPNQKVATPGVKQRHCHDRLHIPVRTTPIRLIKRGVMKVDEISRTVAIVRRIPT